MLSLNFVGKKIKLLEGIVLLESVLELFKQRSIKITTVKSKASQVFLVVERPDESNTSVSKLLKVIVGEEEVSELCVGFKAFTEHLEGILAHLVVAHVDLLNPGVLTKGLGNGGNLGIIEDVLEQVEILDGQNIE